MDLLEHLCKLAREEISKISPQNIYKGINSINGVPVIIYMDNTGRLREHPWYEAPELIETF